MTIPATARALTTSLAGLLVISGCSNSAWNPNPTSQSNIDNPESRCFRQTDFVNRDPAASPQLRLARKNGALWAMEVHEGRCKKTLLAIRFNESKDAKGQPVTYRQTNNDSFYSLDLNTKTKTVFDRIAPLPLPQGLGLSRLPEQQCLAQAMYKTSDRDRNHFYLRIEGNDVYRISYVPSTELCHKTLSGLLDTPPNTERNQSYYELSETHLTERYRASRAPGAPGQFVSIRYQRINTSPSSAKSSFSPGR